MQRSQQHIVHRHVSVGLQGRQPPRLTPPSPYDPGTLAQVSSPQTGDGDTAPNQHARQVHKLCGAQNKCTT